MRALAPFELMQVAGLDMQQSLIHEGLNSHVSGETLTSMAENAFSVFCITPALLAAMTMYGLSEHVGGPEVEVPDGDEGEQGDEMDAKKSSSFGGSQTYVCDRGVSARARGRSWALN